MKISDAVHDAFWNKVGVKPPTKAIGVEEGLKAAIEQYQRETLSLSARCLLFGILIGLVWGIVIMWKGDF